jgi:Domain of unknown function (DUF4340)
MKSTLRPLLSTLLLVAAAAGAVAYAWFGIARKDEATERKKAADEKLYAFTPAAVKAVTVEAKGTTTRVARAGAGGGEGWRVEAPVQADAERATVDALVDRVAELRRKAAVAPAADGAALARYGLARPRARVELALEDGKVETLALGDENPFDGTVFVRTTGGAVELVAGDVRWAVERGTFDLREKRLLPFDEKQLSRVEVTAPKLSYALSREKDGDAWRLDAPLKERADESTASRILGAIRGLRATAFLQDARDDRALGLDRPRWRVKLVGTGGQARTLLVAEAPAAKGATGPRPLHARLDGAREVATVEAGAAKDLEQDLLALRDKTVLRFDREQVAAVRFVSGGSSFDATKEGAPTRLPSALWTLSSLQATAFADETGKALAGRTFARAAWSPRIVEIDPAALAPLPKSPEDLRESAPAPPGAAASAAPK